MVSALMLLLIVCYSRPYAQSKPKVSHVLDVRSNTWLTSSYLRRVAASAFAGSALTPFALGVVGVSDVVAVLAFAAPFVLDAVAASDVDAALSDGLTLGAVHLPFFPSRASRPSARVILVPCVASVGGFSTVTVSRGVRAARWRTSLAPTMTLSRSIIVISFSPLRPFSSVTVRFSTWLT